MLHPKMNEIIAEQKNRYSVVVATAKRARYLAEEAYDNNEELSEKPISLAIKEFEAGKLKIISGEEAVAKRLMREELKRRRAEEAAQREAELAAVKFNDDEEEAAEGEHEEGGEDELLGSLDAIFAEGESEEVADEDEEKDE